MIHLLYNKNYDHKFKFLNIFRIIEFNKIFVYKKFNNWINIFILIN